MTTLLIIISEAAAFFAVVIIIVLVYRIRSRSVLKHSAKQFIKHIKSEDVDHSAKLKNILLNEYDLDESLASNTVEKIIEHEHLLYSKIIELYLGNNDRALVDIDTDVKNLTNVMHNVTINNTKKEPLAPQADIPDSSNEVEELKTKLETLQQEKEQVENELKETMTRMEDMMTEFASMYAGGAGDSDTKIRNELEGAELKKTNNDENSDIELNLDVPDLDIDGEKTE